jgi:Tfp pilus assembly protein PilN
MMGNKEYTGIVLDGDILRLAHIKIEGKKVRLVKLDKYSLVEKIEERPKPQQEDPFAESDIDSAMDEGEEEEDDIFGLDADDLESALLDEGEEEGNDDLNFEDLEEEPIEPEGDEFSLDMVEETGQAQSNEMLFYNILSGIDPKGVNLGLNIEAGDTIFQIIRDTNFKEVKRKDLIQDLEEKLESIYGTPKSDDNYAYEIREDGSLILASVDEEPSLLRLLNSSRQFYNGKLRVEEIYPDEVILCGLVRANYELVEDEITGLLQFGEESCRLVFLNGERLWQVSPIINEGTQNKNFLNTVFSKILFQLDTGEVPNLDRLIIANNTLGDSAIEFFKKNFPDIQVEELRFDEHKFDPGVQDMDTVGAFTTAIGMAWAASGSDKEAYPELSFVPGYVKDRQKIFKLQWHGVLLLLLIFATPITFNHFYQENLNQISSLQNNIQRTDSQLRQIEPTVQSVNELNEDLAVIKEDLVLIDTLSQRSREWSAKMTILNEGIESIRGSWFTNLEQQDDQVEVEGYSLYRSRIPRIADLFDNATLMDVEIEEIREQEVYRFVLSVDDFVEDTRIYSPPRPEELDEFLSE